MNTQYFDEFTKIARAINAHSIVPVLMGSLGLEYVTQKEWHPSDIDIHVEGDPRGWDAPDELRIYQFELIYDVMKSLGYQLIDRH